MQKFYPKTAVGLLLFLLLLCKGCGVSETARTENESAGRLAIASSVLTVAQQRRGSGMETGLGSLNLRNIPYGRSFGDWAAESGREVAIPEELEEYIAGYLLKDRGELQKVMTSLVSDRELTMEEVREFAEDNDAIKSELDSIESFSSATGIWLLADADNDGTKDIFLCEYLGGSLGIVHYYLFIGTGDGHYTLADQTDSLKQEFGFIHWEGKNYLAKTTWEFSSKEIDGISLEYYENGAYQGGVWLAITEKSGNDARGISISYLEKHEYQSLADELAELAKEYHAGTEMGPGTAEKISAQDNRKRSCDIDNDGVAETYEVSVWLSTNYYTVDCLTFSSEENDIEDRIYQLMRMDGEPGTRTPKNLWVNETMYGNVVFILYEEGLYDFQICGYLLSGALGRKVVQVDCRIQTEVTFEPMKRENRE